MKVARAAEPGRLCTVRLLKLQNGKKVKFSACARHARAQQLIVIISNDCKDHQCINWNCWGIMSAADTMHTSSEGTRCK